MQDNVTWTCHDNDTIIYFFMRRKINLNCSVNQTYQELRCNSFNLSAFPSCCIVHIIRPTTATKLNNVIVIWLLFSAKYTAWLINVLKDTGFLLHFTCVVNYLLSRLCQSEVQQKGSTKKTDLEWLFQDTTTITNHKHQFYGSMNQLNGSQQLSTFNLKLSNQTKRLTSVFD